ncbi:hypothetical protein Scani_19760 [Streptomyces caniferus]|uniref:Uncharacterized protein n=1 Tax=Streptomyces caniferus TaxID=285557 RepID=A0A640S3P5_9ACTN|nr:hypothetical protein Scani_19760 [Streptomyces caniferus]
MTAAAVPPRLATCPTQVTERHTRKHPERGRTRDGSDSVRGARPHRAKDFYLRIRSCSPNMDDEDRKDWRE